MITHSRQPERSNEARDSGLPSGRAVGCTNWLGKLVLLIPILAIAFVIYFLANSLNPESRLCLYKIYKQPDGSYEVWWSCKTRHIEEKFATYEQAKAFQVEKCRSLGEFMRQKPSGERVK